MSIRIFQAIPPLFRAWQNVGDIPLEVIQEVSNVRYYSITGAYILTLVDEVTELTVNSGDWVIISSIGEVTVLTAANFITTYDPRTA